MSSLWVLIFNQQVIINLSLYGLAPFSLIIFVSTQIIANMRQVMQVANTTQHEEGENLQYQFQ
jgi:hypothetical protein